MRNLKFFSEEWAQEYMKALNANKNYAAAASWWVGDFMFGFEASGNLDHEIRFYTDLWHGKCRKSYVLEPGQEQEAAYTFSGPWSNFVSLIEGKLDPLKGLVRGKFKLKGSMAKVMRAVKASKQLVATILMVDTELY